jgi:hypothetical protein
LEDRGKDRGRGKDRDIDRDIDIDKDRDIDIDKDRNRDRDKDIDIDKDIKNDRAPDREAPGIAPQPAAPPLQRTSGFRVSLIGHEATASVASSNRIRPPKTNLSEISKDSRGVAMRRIKTSYLHRASPSGGGSRRINSTRRFLW